MSRKFIASVVAAAMAVTSFSAAPAAAGDKNLERFLIGAGTLLIIGTALNEHNNNSKATVSHRQDLAHGYGSHHGKKKKAKKRNRRALPGYCLRRVETRHGMVRMFGKRCLRNNFRYFERLPQACKIKVRTWSNGHKVKRVGYKPRCLRHYGYHVANRH